MGNLLTIAHPETGRMRFGLFNKYVAFYLHCPEWVMFVPLGTFLEESQLRQSGVTGQCKEQIQRKREEKKETKSLQTCYEEALLQLVICIIAHRILSQNFD